MDISAAAREIDKHLRQAQEILDDYLNPDGRYRTAALALNELLPVLDSVDLIRAQRSLQVALGEASTEPERG